MIIAILVDDRERDRMLHSTTNGFCSAVLRRILSHVAGPLDENVVYPRRARRIGLGIVIALDLAHVVWVALLELDALTRALLNGYGSIRTATLLLRCLGAVSSR